MAEENYMKFSFASVSSFIGSPLYPLVYILSATFDVPVCVRVGWLRWSPGCTTAICIYTARLFFFLIVLWSTWKYSFGLQNLLKTRPIVGSPTTLSSGHLITCLCVYVCDGEGADLWAESQVSALWTLRQGYLLQYDLHRLLLTGTRHKSVNRESKQFLACNVFIIIWILGLVFWPAICSCLTENTNSHFAVRFPFIPKGTYALVFD